MTLAVAEADAEADYLSTIVSPTATYRTALAAAEIAYAKSLSRGKFIDSQQQFFARWNTDYQEVAGSFIERYYTTTNDYRLEAINAVYQAARENLPNLASENGYPIPREEQITRHQTPPSNHVATPANSGRSRPITQTASNENARLGRKAVPS